MDKIVTELMKNVMKSRRLNQQILCRGICDESMISRYLSGEREPDRITFNVLLQRLGVSPDHFITILSSQEYIYFHWKMQLLQAVGQSKWHTVRQLLDSPTAIGAGGNKLMQQQFVFIIRGILAEEQEHNTDDAVSCFTQALLLTHPDCAHETEYILDLMSNQEWCALLNLIYLTKDTSASSVTTLQNILYQLEKHPIDELELVKIYPYAVYLLLTCYFHEGRYATCEKLCQKAIALLRKNCTLGNLPELMEYDIQCKKILQKITAAEEEQRQLDALQYVLHDCPVNRRWLFTPMLESGQEIYIWGKLLSQKRKEMKMSQKKLCDGICAVSTLRNIEAGKTVPGKHTMQMLLERLELPVSYLKSDIITTDFRILDLHQKLKKLSARNDRSELTGYLNDLKMHLDLSILANRQWIQFYQSLCDYKNGVLNNQTYLNHILSILRQSIPAFCPSSISSCQLNHIEVLLIIQLARGYEYTGNYVQAIEILEELLLYYKKQEVAFEYQYRKVTMITYNLAIYYARSGNYNQSMELLKSILPGQISCNRTLFFPGTIMEMAHVQLKQNHAPEAKKYYGIAVLLGKLFYLENVTELSQKWYDEL